MQAPQYSFTICVVSDMFDILMFYMPRFILVLGSFGIQDLNVWREMWWLRLVGGNQHTATTLNTLNTI